MTTQRWARFVHVAVAAAVGFVVSACGGATASSPTGPEVIAPEITAPVSGGGHVVVAMFENKAYSQIAGSPDAPYLNSLMSRAAVFTDAHGITHPSQPNYVALFSGSTHGVTDDHCPVRLGTAPNLATQLQAAGRTFAGYSEALPSPGYRGCSSGRYAAKHNPWVDFENVPAAANLPYSAWPADPAQLPTVAFVIPDLCNDMHDCSIATGDAWARDHLDAYLRWAATHDSVLIVTFDEDNGTTANGILTLVAGAGIAPGPRAGRVDHYSVLRTIEDRYGLGGLGAAATARALPL